MRRMLLVFVAVAVVASGCAKKADNVTLTLGSVPKSVHGNVVSIPVNVTGIRIVKADGDTSGKTGHFHVFIDRAPLPGGKIIPKVRGIVHSADNPIKIYGLTPGLHRFRVVLGNGIHRRIDPKARKGVKVDVKGPGVQGTAPATINKGQDLVVKLAAEGVKIVEPGTEASDKEAHYHVLVDPASPPAAGAMIAEGHAMGKASSAYMTGGTSQTIPGLAAGEHVIWVVLANKDHEALSPAVMDKITVTVA